MRDAGSSCVGCEVVMHGMRGCCARDAGSHLKYSPSVSCVVMPKARDAGFLERGSDDGHGRGLEMTRASAEVGMENGYRERAGGCGEREWWVWRARAGVESGIGWVWRVRVGGR